MEKPEALGEQFVRRSTWAAILVGAYAAVQSLAWHRTLIPDEIRPLLLARGALGQLLEFARQDIVQTPLSYLVGREWLEVFGHTDSAAKALALTLGIATIVLFTHVAGRFTEHWRFASLLLCLIYLRVGSSPNLVRMYGLALLLSVAALYFWDRWRLDPTHRNLAAWCTTMVLLSYTHGSGLLLLAGFVFATMLCGPAAWSSRFAFMIAAGISVLALVPWVAYVYPVFADRGIVANVRSIPGRPTAVLGRLPFLFLSGFDPGGGSPPLPMHSPAVIQPMKWVAILLHGALLVSAWPLLVQRPENSATRGHNYASTAIMLSICVAPVALLYGFSVLVIHAFHPRYLIVLFPAYCLLLTLLGHAGARFGRFVLIGLILPWLILSSGLTLTQHLGRMPLERGTEIVARERAETDIVLCNRHMPIGYQVLWDWTRRLHRPEPVYILKAPAAPWLQAAFPGVELGDLELGNVTRVWFFHQAWRPNDLVSSYLADLGYTTRREIVDDWYHLTLFERRPRIGDSTQNDAARGGEAPPVPLAEQPPNDSR